ncbi:hypothetical protein [Companilactobacillus paralimentarius]|uniref:hypothetical protein n=1 Tax=Companilactobacillus paralimentarius TaxID=83526 RepID=UPI0037E0184F
MTENNYIDFDEIEKKYEEEIKAHNRKIEERHEKEAEKEHQEMSHLMDGLTDKITSDTTENREEERKQAKAKAIKEIDAKYDKQGLVKSEDEKEQDQAYMGLLDSLHINDDKSDTSSTLNKMLVDKDTYNKGLGIDDNKERTPLDKEYLDIINNFKSKDDSDTSVSQYFK